jgi:hypothetical protein
MDISKSVSDIHLEMIKKQEELIKNTVEERLGYLPSLSELKDRLSMISVAGKEERIQLDGKDLISFGSINSKLNDSGENKTLEFDRKIYIF